MFVEYLGIGCDGLGWSSHGVIKILIPAIPANSASSVVNVSLYMPEVSLKILVICPIFSAPLHSIGLLHPFTSALGPAGFLHMAIPVCLSSPPLCH